ncbi:hypothetical protein M5K25_014019 [Dendrobium thyrsiflorum]|uniref:Uncharacterized protein n=1 Tax=Dendrobium thyrsiflorum TaxID=117978 RepID=A0ABD0UV80_DENTH
MVMQMFFTGKILVWKMVTGQRACSRQQMLVVIALISIQMKVEVDWKLYMMVQNLEAVWSKC